MAFLGIKTPCLVPCLPPFTFGCRDENGDLPCQEGYYAHRQSQTQTRQEGRTKRKTIEEETDLAKQFGADYIDSLDAATTGDSNRSSGAEEIGALGSVLGEVTGAIAQFGVLGGIFGGDGGDAANQADTPLGSFEFTNTAIVLGGIGIGLLLLSQRR